MRKYRHTKQQLRQIVPQKDLRAPIKIDLGWTTTDMMRKFSWGSVIRIGSFPQMSQNTKREEILKRQIKVNQILRSIHL